MLTEFCYDRLILALGATHNRTLASILTLELERIRRERAGARAPTQTLPLILDARSALGEGGGCRGAGGDRAGDGGLAPGDGGLATTVGGLVGVKVGLVGTLVGGLVGGLVGVLVGVGTRGFTRAVQVERAVLTLQART